MSERVQPDVSIIVPNFRHARYLKQRLDSILSQTFTNWEMIFLDDASDDDSLQVFAPYSTDPRIQSIVNTKNSASPFKQWNRGIERARACFIWIAESDDYADPKFLEKMLTVLKKDSSIGLSYCESVVINSDGQPLQDVASPPLSNSDYVTDGKQFCRDLMIRQNMICNASAVVFRKELYESIGGADESMRLLGDWKFWMQMLQETRLAHVAERLNYFRTHPRNVRSSMASFSLLRESAELLEWMTQNVTTFSHNTRIHKNGMARPLDQHHALACMAGWPAATRDDAPDPPTRPYFLRPARLSFDCKVILASSQASHRTLDSAHFRDGPSFTTGAVKLSSV